MSQLPVYNIYKILYDFDFPGAYFYIMEMPKDKEKKTKRYFCIVTLENDFEIFKIQSISSLIEYLDKNNIALARVSPEERNTIYLKVIETLYTYENKNSGYERQPNSSKLFIKLLSGTIINKKFQNLSKIGETDLKLLNQDMKVESEEYKRRK